MIMQRRGVRRHLCRVAEANSHGPVQETIEILQLQYTDKVIDAVVQVPFSSADVERTAELPQLHSYFCLDKVVDTPVVCNDRCRGGTVHGGCGRPCDHTATSCFDSGSATDSVLR